MEQQNAEQNIPQSTVSPTAATEATGGQTNNTDCSNSNYNISREVMTIVKQ